MFHRIKIFGIKILGAEIDEPLLASRLGLQFSLFQGAAEGRSYGPILSIFGAMISPIWTALRGQSGSLVVGEKHLRDIFPRFPRFETGAWCENLVKNLHVCFHKYVGKQRAFFSLIHPTLWSNPRIVVLKPEVFLIFFGGIFDHHFFKVQRISRDHVWVNKKLARLGRVARELASDLR